jgi:MATE family multidrug resistance protein
METLLVFLGQDPSIAHEAGRYAACLIPGLFAYAVLQPLTRYFQNQSMITPLLITSCFVFCLHVPLCWLLVYKSGLGNLGGALALSFSNCLYTIILGSLMCFSSACSETRAPLSMEIFDGIGEFFRYALPSAAMIWYFIFLGAFSLLNAFTFWLKTLSWVAAWSGGHMNS